MRFAGWHFTVDYALYQKAAAGLTNFDGRSRIATQFYEPD